MPGGKVFTSAEQHNHHNVPIGYRRRKCLIEFFKQSPALRVADFGAIQGNPGHALFAAIINEIAIVETIAEFTDSTLLERSVTQSLLYAITGPESTTGKGCRSSGIILGSARENITCYQT